LATIVPDNPSVADEMSIRAFRHELTVATSFDQMTMWLAMDHR
jgi:hypothetical protein